MITFYRFIKSGITVGALALLAWYSANSFAAQNDQTDRAAPISELDTQTMKKKPKLLSEMTAAEKAKLSKEEVKKLQELEEKLKKAEKPKY